MSKGLEILGIVFGFIGFITAIITCVLPMWKVTAFNGANIITPQVIWEGLWMKCVTQSTWQMQCKIYDSMLALPQNLQAARAMMVISIVMGILGVLISFAGANCTNCIKDEAAKTKMMIISGIFFILSSILVLIPVRWIAHNIIQDDPLLFSSQRKNLGASVYIGWASAALFLIGGAILCGCCSSKEDNYNPPRVSYSAPRSTG